MKIIEKGNGLGSNWIYVGNVRDIGVKKIDKFVNNLNLIYEQAEKARKSGFHIEAISLYLQIIDFWLRVLIHWKEKKTIGLNDYFGNTLNNSKKYLSPDIFKKVVQFNRRRRKAIHHYVYGHGDYLEITETSEFHKNLPKEVGDYILNKIRSEKKISPH